MITNIKYDPEIRCIVFNILVDYRSDDIKSFEEHLKKLVNKNVDISTLVVHECIADGTHTRENLFYHIINWGLYSNSHTQKYTDILLSIKDHKPDNDIDDDDYVAE